MNNVEHLWSLLCVSTSIDNQSNNISLYNIVEEVSVKKAKYIDSKEILLPVNLNFVSLWKKLDDSVQENFEQKIILESPSGEELGGSTHSFSFKENLKRMRVIVKIDGLKLVGGGEYLFKIGLRGEGEKDFKEFAIVPLGIKFE